MNCEVYDSDCIVSIALLIEKNWELLNKEVLIWNKSGLSGLQINSGLVFYDSVIINLCLVI